jgi:hemerythrin-like domain-containing protein
MIQIGAPSATLDAPVEHLMACHRRIEQRLETLNAAACHLESRREEALEAIGKCIQFLDSNGAMHTEDEESSLFPRLRPKLSADELAFVDSLEHQHGQAEGIYAELKRIVALAGSQPHVSASIVKDYRDCAAQLQELYREHIRSEDEILARLANRWLTQQELIEISSEMRERRNR